MITTKASNASNYSLNGIFLSPSIPTSGDKVKVTYDGLLAKSGATDLSARIGFGDDWKNLNEYRMTKSSDGFYVSIPVINANTLNVCFKDSANNWDNNSGNNYIFEIK